MTALFAKVGDLQKQLTFLRAQLTSYEERSIQDEVNTSLQRKELLKHLDDRATEVIEKVRWSDEFELAAALWSRYGLIRVLKGMSKDIIKVDANFPLDQLLFLKDFLVLQAREAEMKKATEEEGFWRESESSEEAPSSPPKGTPTSPPSTPMDAPPTQYFLLKEAPPTPYSSPKDAAPT